ncbi:hypothetical protein [Nodularia sphaerocarpa]|uniref:hypothetical protein n=1 Tax=Nodularia sphaerocarpa TaxID=137816 RepID=UPI001EFA77E4|nr:hypothetical protein [Nodularia sphaerocarpa]MDB9374370.1 hypothetical protein [Nodularia sphaerocarpa CS-585]MDB9376401.1 hypothetical protein [Nodularia sphaerocarpa CS-585A2]
MLIVSILAWLVRFNEPPSRQVRQEKKKILLILVLSSVIQWLVIGMKGVVLQVGIC